MAGANQVVQIQGHLRWPLAGVERDDEHLVLVAAREGVGVVLRVERGEEAVAQHVMIAPQGDVALKIGQQLVIPRGSRPRGSRRDRPALCPPVSPISSP